VSWTLWGLAVQTIAGFLGAHAAAGAAHEYRFGFIGHSITGLVGGALSGRFPPRGSRHDRDGQRQPESVDGRGNRRHPGANRGCGWWNPHVGGRPLARRRLGSTIEGPWPPHPRWAAVHDADGRSADREDLPNRSVPPRKMLDCSEGRGRATRGGGRSSDPAPAEGPEVLAGCPALGLAKSITNLIADRPAMFGF